TTKSMFPGVAETYNSFSGDQPKNYHVSIVVINYKDIRGGASAPGWSIRHILIGRFTSLLAALPERHTHQV
ncbi:MAG: hypothetical protein ACRC5A_16375, partial [Enterobacteriaceae bacterium]